MKIQTFLIPFLAFCLTACDGAEMQAEQTEPTPLVVNVVRPQAMTFKPTLLLPGTVTAKERIAVATPLQGVQILAVNVEAGESVKKGQVLAQLEAANVESQWQQHSAQLEKAKANLSSQQSALKEAEETLKRYRTLMKSDAISRQELESQQAKVAAAQAAVKSANAEIAEVQAQLGNSRHQRHKAEVIAPADGIIIKRNAESGNLTDSTALFEIAKDGVMELESQANAAEIALLQTGLRASIRTPNGRTTIGSVRLVLPELDSTTRLGKVRIHLDNPTELPVGAFAEAEIHLAEINAPFALPLSAVAIQSANQGNVMVIDEQQKAVKKAVVFDKIQHNQVEIISGLNTNDRVVKQAAAFVEEGDIVKAIEEAK